MCPEVRIPPPRPAFLPAALICALLAVVAQAGASGRVSPTAFTPSVSPLGTKLRASINGVSWRPGCPVPLRDLRAVRLVYWGFDGRVHRGLLVAHRDAAADLVAVFRRLYDARFPIRRMAPVDVYGGSDFASIEADNTSAFNCRPVAGTSHWSNHAYGRAIDVNPIENPYVTAAGSVAHAASRAYVTRSRARPGMAIEGGVLVRAFEAVGWGWGGRWSGDRDYQHFSATGR
jgi:hypothetical protein